MAVWDARARSLQRSVPLGFQARSCAFSSQPVASTPGKHHLAVGGKLGHVKVVDETNLQVTQHLTPQPTERRVS